MRPVMFYCGDLCNLGDLALLLQNLEHLPSGSVAYVRRWNPLPPEIVRQVNAAGGRLVDGRGILSFIRLASTCDVVIGGGQLVRDNVSLASLIAQYAGARAARARGGRVTTRGLGVSALRDPRRRTIWRALLRLAEEVRVRDSASAANAIALVGKERVRQTADAAFMPGRLNQRAGSEPQARDRIIIAPCIDRSEDRATTAASITDIVNAARAQRPADQLLFACHDPRPGMDRDAAEQLISASRLESARISASYDLDALLSEYRHASLVVTNRLHAIIFALLSGCAVVVLDDGNAKTQFIAERFGLPLLAGDAGSYIAKAVESALNFDAACRRGHLSDMSTLAAANFA
ncbi:polysaccharide pyruvyl transferase family protein [uncultured Sphingomonas sp.]|uniref:polysaccharide pyruvyl transferase family protein n=1 Tax=unclassified Sphingomonas TaxID=196159 RepID=UPI0025F45182|nr:polysaccharide pyruvyl transferase family protein [uncultured Sphingomonas sp.]